MNTLAARRVRSLPGLSFVLAALALGGCASKTKQPAGELVLQPAAPGVTTKDYKYVTRLGSHIPVRVPKHGNTQPAPGASPVEYLSGEILTDIVTRPMSGRR